MRVVPVINENDTVATAEIRYGDNDRLAARVAAMVGADCLVLLSDIDGLYTAPPAIDPDGAIHRLRPRDHAGDRGDGRRRRLGALARRHEDQDRGGPIATAAGAAMVIASGRRKTSARGDRCGRALHLVRAAGDARQRQQGVDRRPPGAARHDHRRCRRGGGAAGRQEPASGRRDRRRGRLFARRCGGYPGRRRAPRSARGLVAFDLDDARRIVGARRARSRQCSAIGAAPR